MHFYVEFFILIKPAWIAFFVCNQNVLTNTVGGKQLTEGHGTHNKVQETRSLKTALSGSLLCLAYSAPVYVFKKFNKKKIVSFEYWRASYATDSFYKI